MLSLIALFLLINLVKRTLFNIPLFLQTLHFFNSTDITLINYFGREMQGIFEIFQHEDYSKNHLLFFITFTL